MIYLIYQKSCEFCEVPFPEQRYQIRPGEILPLPYPNFFKGRLLCDSCRDKLNNVENKLIKDIQKSKKAKK